MDKSSPAAPAPPANGNKDKNVVLLRQADVLITGELATRSRKTSDLDAEAAALLELAALTAEQPEAAVQRFLEHAIALCGAGSAGLSLIEERGGHRRAFRWDALAGPLAGQGGEAAPFDFSPCGLCLAAGRPTLVNRPSRAFGYLETLAPAVMEGLITPLYDTGGVPLGTLWVVHHDAERRFDAEDARVMEQLAGLLVVAVKLRAARRQSGAVAVPKDAFVASARQTASPRPAEAVLRDAEGLEIGRAHV